MNLKEKRELHEMIILLSVESFHILLCKQTILVQTIFGGMAL